MQKLAVFCEGYTELQFVERLIIEIAGRNRVAIEHRVISGGKTVARKTLVIRSPDRSVEAEFYVLLVDCRGETNVKTRLLEEHKNLSNSGYSLLIAIRDVRPQFLAADIPRLRNALRYGLSGALAPYVFILPTMETEAWLMAEHSHFARMFNGTTPEEIFVKLGFNPATDDLALLNVPSAELDKCYAIAGGSYVKGNNSSTFEALDFDQIYLDTQHRVPELAALISHLDTFLTLPVVTDGVPRSNE